MRCNVQGKNLGYSLCFYPLSIWWLRIMTFVISGNPGSDTNNWHVFQCRVFFSDIDLHPGPGGLKVFFLLHCSALGKRQSQLPGQSSLTFSGHGGQKSKFIQLTQTLIKQEAARCSDPHHCSRWSWWRSPGRLILPDVPLVSVPRLLAPLLAPRELPLCRTHRLV